MIRVLVADNSPRSRQSIVRALQQLPDIRVIGEASDSQDVCDFIAAQGPDVVVLSSSPVPGSGLAFLRHLTTRLSARVVWCSPSHSAPVSAAAIAHGACTVVAWPPETDGYFRPARELAAAVRGAFAAPDTRGPAESGVVGRRVTLAQAPTPMPHVIGIGSSSGGASTVEQLLLRLGPDAPPVLLVQHLPPYIVDVFAQRLRNKTGLKVELARNGAPLRPGVVFLAPSQVHLTTQRLGAELCVRLVQDARSSGQRPAIDLLFSSLARTAGSLAAGLLLTGTGRDGATGLLAMRIAGGSTLVQDEGSSLAWDLPKAALELGAAQEVLPLRLLAERLAQWSKRTNLPELVAL
jgi:two-component system, chemotaxis family, protein-glutamate methylesterase/glutaminase